jgi:putative FmdB family regulatory protein
MPLREFICNKCKKTIELILKQNESGPTQCNCGGTLEALFPTKVAVIYKCPGFSRTDYPSKSSKLFKKEDIEKLDKEQKLSLAVNLLEKQGVNLEK